MSATSSYRCVCRCRGGLLRPDLGSLHRFVSALQLTAFETPMTEPQINFLRKVRPAQRQRATVKVLPLKGRLCNGPLVAMCGDMRTGSANTLLWACEVARGLLAPLYISRQHQLWLQLLLLLLLAACYCPRCMPQ
jgi:hypothetical protein